MRIEYTTLTNSNEKFVVTFDYSPVTSTPQFGLQVFRKHPTKLTWDDVPAMSGHAEGEAAVEEIRKHLKRCQDFTQLHDRPLQSQLNNQLKSQLGDK